MGNGRGFARIRMAVAIAALLSLAPAAGAEERVVNFYNWSNYMAQGVLEDFTKETGIKVVYDTFDANETLETRLLAGKSGYDVVVPTGDFLQRQITAKVFLKLDKSKLPNLANAWPVVTSQLATYDPGNDYAANYMWGTTGIGYNVKTMQKILGPDARIDSWDIVFKPENLAKFKDCGIHMLDSADDILPAALGYLGIDPNSTRQADLEKAADLVSKIRPNVRKFHSSEYLGALASGEICFVVEADLAGRQRAQIFRGIKLADVGPDLADEIGGLFQIGLPGRIRIDAEIAERRGENVVGGVQHVDAAVLELGEILRLEHDIPAIDPGVRPEDFLHRLDVVADARGAPHVVGSVIIAGVIGGE